MLKQNFTWFLLDSLKDELRDVTANVTFPYFALHIDSLAVQGSISHLHV